ncbi:acyl carrier protein [Saccharothrix obliqua]|uniref:acyl carrier protein n=1 Tax=Saccharothrix obliqua TaxID=2861747 RepID=UPI001C5D9CDB|nr:acyl carrier protein [Saccharothrix obliqua]MBW4721898.1 acyl carrier protein [Saccharothrix obliqua]
MSTEVEIKSFIVRNFAPDVPPDQLEPDLNLLDSGVVDSLGLLRLIAWVGERFDIAVEEADISPDNFRSVDAIAAFVADARRNSEVAR